MKYGSTTQFVSRKGGRGKGAGGGVGWSSFAERIRSIIKTENVTILVVQLPDGGFLNWNFCI